MKTLLIAALVAVGLAAPADAKDIWFNPGGDVAEFATAILHDKQTHLPIRILGLCASACTMGLGEGNVCVADDALFMFHGAYTDPKDIAGSQSKVGTAEMESFYPKSLRAYLKSLGGLTATEIWLHGRDLVTIGAAKRC
jgi:hypothetical protein